METPCNKILQVFSGDSQLFSPTRIPDRFAILSYITKQYDEDNILCFQERFPKLMRPNDLLYCSLSICNAAIFPIWFQFDINSNIHTVIMSEEILILFNKLSTNFTHSKGSIFNDTCPGHVVILSPDPLHVEQPLVICQFQSKPDLIPLEEFQVFKDYRKFKNLPPETPPPPITINNKQVNLVIE